MDDHCGHQLTYIEEAIETAKLNNIKLTTETRAAIVAIREAIENVQRVSESVDVRSHQAATEVRTAIRR